MKSQDDQILQESLMQLSKHQLIYLCMKLQKGFQNTVTHLSKIENKLAELTDLDELLSSIENEKK